jgi:hypothetical protein
VRSLSIEQLRAHAQRDWTAIARAKRLGVTVGSHDEALALSQSLWDHMHRLEPSWPDDAQRRADFDHHQRLVQLGRRLRDAGFPR